MGVFMSFESERSFPRLTVDGIVFIEDDEVVLVRRKYPPFKGFWALPGGFVEYGETVEDAVKREIFEETSLKVEIISLVGVYSDPSRDPRGHVVTIVFKCRALTRYLEAKTDAELVKVFKISDLKNLNLAFDHGKILKDAEIIR